MWKNLNEFSKLKKEYNKNWKKQIVDILVFGSLVKGKTQPNDIDICLIFKDQINLEIIKEVQEILGDKYHISSLNTDNFFTKPHSLARTLLLEGQSILSKKKLSDNFGLFSNLLYSYDISKETPSKKVRFVYLLRGRGKEEGIVNKFKGSFISNNAFIIPIEKDNEMQEILNQWQIRYQRKKFMLMD